MCFNNENYYQFVKRMLKSFVYYPDDHYVLSMYMVNSMWPSGMKYMFFTEYLVHKKARFIIMAIQF